MKEIKARTGYYLTQVEDVGENRLYLTAIKGMNLNEADWREATLEEKEAWEKAQEEKNKSTDSEN
jgi:hypothetical protein